jgi:uncharacterized membrane protein YGL010W
MRDIHSLFADYASFHQTRGNKWFHRAGIPMIMLTLLGMLARVEIPALTGVRIDAAILLVAAAGLYYLVLEWRLGLAMIGVSIIFYIAGAAIPFVVNVAFFVLGWVLQFIGHSVYERRQPAFFQNFVHLLIGPLWILNDVVPVVKKSPDMPHLSA